MISLDGIIKNMGLTHLNKMQKATLKAAASNDNIQLIAPTGSGKTLAYCLAILSNINVKEGGVQCLILAPTRELVIQIESVLKSIKIGLKVNAVYGGHKFAIEKQNFSSPPSILVGTPGRIKDHLSRRTFNPDTITQIVFDEYDKSLEYGFESQMTAILDQLKYLKRHLLVSATNKIEVPDFLKLNKLEVIEFQDSSSLEKRTFRQLVVPDTEKLMALSKVLSILKTGENAIVFVNHRDTASRIKDYLKSTGVSYSIFHGGLKQNQRELELIKFRNGSSNVLVATDMAGRGIDVPDLNYVIHYQMPVSKDVFTHRNGRTARMNANGTVVLLLTQNELIPDYITKEPVLLKESEFGHIPQPGWRTFFIGRGKKDKINKIDIVGYFTSFNFINSDDLGLIEVLDFNAFVAVSSTKVDQILELGKKGKIKGKTVKIELIGNA